MIATAIAIALEFTDNNNNELATHGAAPLFEFALEYHLNLHSRSLLREPPSGASLEPVYDFFSTIVDLRDRRQRAEKQLEQRC